MIEGKKWNKFKNLADAIELAKQRGCLVSWSKKDEEVYFDVVIDINEPPSSYLIVVKCIESKEAVTQKQVEDFIKQAQQAKAGIAILASESGFEELAGNFVNIHL